MLKAINLNTIFSFYILLYSSFVNSQNIETYIPKKALTYIPILKEEVFKYFPNNSYKEYFAGLAEQESCISLTHSKCWDPSSQLLTKREQGSGIFQITRAYNKNNSIRFDSLQGMKNKYNTELKELSWASVLSRPDLQIRTMLLMTRENYSSFHTVHSELERLKMTDASYNAGIRSVKKRRLICGMKENCNPQKWDDNVGSIIVLSQKPIYGNRSPQFINDEHVDLIFNKRMNKYKKLMN